MTGQLLRAVDNSGELRWGFQMLMDVSDEDASGQASAANDHVAYIQRPAGR